MLAIVTIYRNKTQYTVSAEIGQTLLAVLQSAGIRDIEATCGGNGRCGKCLVKAVGAISPSEDMKKEYKLSCQTKVMGDCTIFLEDEKLVDALSFGLRKNRLLSRLQREGIGAAVDIGTTTVVLYLADLSTGEIVDIQSGMNAQRAFGADVISRVEYTLTHEHGLNHLSDIIREQINAYLHAACSEAGREIGDLKEIAIAGNTIMSHIFAGYSPKTIALAPFTTVSLFGEYITANSMGLSDVPDVPVFIAPCVAGYVGGDITAGLLASGADEADETCFYLDIGTNGEMALGSRAGFLCCATAAGPAFEGAEITCGMPGIAGAISAIWFSDGMVRYQVIGEGTPQGICGSGLVDALAMLLDLGAVDETGRLLKAEEAPVCIQPYLGEQNGRVIFYIDEAHTIFISEADIRKLQLAKAAVAAGIMMLLDESGLTAANVNTVYLAGGFGSYMDKRNAAAIGLIPEAFVPKLIPAGNAAGMGAVSKLLYDGAKEQLIDIQKKCKYLELSFSLRFNEHFVDCMTF